MMVNQKQPKLSKKLLFLPALIHFVVGSLIYYILYSKLRSWETAGIQMHKYVVVYIPVMLLFLLPIYLKKLRLVNITFKLLLNKPKFSSLCISVVIGIGLGIFNFCLFKFLTPHFTFPQLGSGLQIINWIGAIVIAPVCEELIFRGYGRECFKPNDKKIKALLITSFAFALWHYNPFVMFLAFIGGLILYLLYLKTDSLIPSILAHSVLNFVALIAIIF